MNDALLMDIGQGIEGLEDHGQDHCWRQVRAMFDQPPQFLTGDEVHRQIHDVVLLAASANPDDAGVAQPHPDLRFLVETGQHHVPLRPDQQISADGLERNRFTVIDPDPAINHAHGPASQDGFDTVGAEGLAGSQHGGSRNR